MKPLKEDPDSRNSDHEFWQPILAGLDEPFVIAQPIDKINSSELCEISPDRSWAAAEQQLEFQDHGKQLLGNNYELVQSRSDPSEVLEPVTGCTDHPKDHRHAHAQANWNLVEVPTNATCTNSNIKLTEAVGNLKGNAFSEGTPELSPHIFQNLDFCSLPSFSSIKGAMPALPTLSSMTEGLDPQMCNTKPEASISCHDNNIMGMIRCNSFGEIGHAGKINEVMIAGGLPDQLASNVDERMGGGLCWDQLQGYCKNSSSHQKLLPISSNLIEGMTAKHCIEDQPGLTSRSGSRLNHLSESRLMNETRRLMNETRKAVERNNTDISYSKLSQYFNMPITQAARELKVGLTVLKKKCREFGIPRWPHRKMKSLGSLIHNIQELAKSNGGPSQAGLSNAVQILEEQKKSMEKIPGTELAERTKRLRQACFKANYKKRRQMMCAGRIANTNNNSDTSSSSNQVTEFPPQPSTCSSISDCSGSISSLS